MRSETSIFLSGMWTLYRDCCEKHADKPLFYTHTPGGFLVGSVRDGHRITRIRRAGYTALAYGGVAPCWQVRGVKIGSVTDR